MARIVFTLEDGVEIQAELDSDVITVGRHPESIVVLPSGSVSSHHATIKRRGPDFYVQDLGTTNGTKLNGVEVEEAKLDDGDTVTFGDIPGIVYLTEPTSIPAAPAMPAPNFAPAPSAVPSPNIVRPSAPPLATPAATRRKIAAQKRIKSVEYKESTGCASFLMFLVFIVIAFAAGLHLRHYRETQHILLNDIVDMLKKRAIERAEHSPAAPEPAQDSGSPAGKAN